MWVDQFITELQGKYLPFKYPDPRDPTKLADCTLQLGVRPIQLYEIGFPEDQKDIVFSSLLSNPDGSNNNKKFMRGAISWIRKFIGLDPIPEFKRGMEFPICKQNLEIVGVGTKKDYFQDCKTGKRYDHKANENCFEGV